VADQPLSAVANSTARPVLLPRPRKIRTTGSRVRDRAADESIGIGLPPQGYRLSVTPQRITIEAADADGLRYGRATLAQLRHGSNSPTGSPDGQAPECEIDDWPDFATRGVMLDISRDKVPKMETLLALVERLASWKINHVELYIEHTFAYAGHDEVWREADPFTAVELAELDRGCTALGIDLVPNQNTLGHFDRWLRHDRYRQLAITPDGFEWMMGITRSATTLDPAKPGSFELVSDILGQLVTALDKTSIHIGLDEPWELPRSRAGEWADWLDRLAALDALQGRELLVWGDMPAGHPELIDRVSKLSDVVAARGGKLAICEWGYEGNHPFPDRLEKLNEAGVASWVCPGTSSWMSITGRAPDMLENIRNAAESGVAAKSDGFLVTDWGDFGHHQYLPASEPGFAAAADLSWCSSVEPGREQLDLPALARLLSAHAFDDPEQKTGEVLIALGSVHRLVGPQPPNMSPLVGNLLFPQLPVGRAATPGMTVEDLARVEEALDAAMAELAGARPRRPDAGLLSDELRGGAQWLRFSCADARARLAGDGTLGSVPAQLRSELGALCDNLIVEHRRLWLERNRPGGLADSVAWLDHLNRCYLSGNADPGWFGPNG
jgi:hexosaminidase